MEPFLIQSGLLKRTARGREVTAGAWKHLGLEPPAPRNGEPSSDTAPGQGDLL